MPLPPRLEEELVELRGRNHQIDVTEDPDFISVVLIDFALGDGYSREFSDLLLRVPRAYPDAGPDMFWTTPDLLLANGQPPQSGEVIEQYLGRPWRRFSWHRPVWNPSIDNLHAYLEFIRKRLRERK